MGLLECPALKWDCVSAGDLAQRSNLQHDLRKSL